MAMQTGLDPILAERNRKKHKYFLQAQQQREHDAAERAAKKKNDKNDAFGGGISDQQVIINKRRHDASKYDKNGKRVYDDYEQQLLAIDIFDPDFLKHDVTQQQ